MLKELTAYLDARIGVKPKFKGKAVQVPKGSLSRGHSYTDYNRKFSISLAFTEGQKVVDGKDNHLRSINYK